MSGDEFSKPFTLLPLSPVHIGAGSMLEPIEYVIQDNKLFQFSAVQMVRALTPQALSELGRLAEKARCADDILQLRSLIKCNADALAQESSHCFLVSPELVKTYDKSLTKVTHRGNKAQNKLELSRHIHNPVTKHAYIPGSTLKGAIRGAIINSLIQKKGFRNYIRKREGVDVEKAVLSYQKAVEDPFKNLKISDAMPEKVIQRFEKCLNFSKKLDKQEGCIPVQVENVQIGSQFTGQLSWQQRGNDFQQSIEEIVKAMNNFYYPKFVKHIKRAKQDKRIKTLWAEQIEDLCQSTIKAMGASKSAAVIQIGRYGGAESKSWDDLRRIKNVKAKNQKDKVMNDSTTFWLNEQKLPMGWALLVLGELSSEEQSNLKRFQEALSGSLIREFEEIETALLALKQNKISRLAEQKRKQEQEEMQAKAEAEREVKRAQMSETERQIDALNTLFEGEKKFNIQNPTGPVRQEISRLAGLSVTESWPEKDRRSLRNLIKEIVKYWGINVKKNKKLKEILQQLD